MPGSPHMGHTDHVTSGLISQVAVILDSTASHQLYICLGHTFPFLRAIVHDWQGWFDRHDTGGNDRPHPRHPVHTALRGRSSRLNYVNTTIWRVLHPADTPPAPLAPRWSPVGCVCVAFTSRTRCVWTTFRKGHERDTIGEQSDMSLSIVLRKLSGLSHDYPDWAPYMPR